MNGVLVKLYFSYVVDVTAVIKKRSAENVLLLLNSSRNEVRLNVCKNNSTKVGKSIEPKGQNIIFTMATKRIARDELMHLFLVRYSHLHYNTTER